MVTLLLWTFNRISWKIYDQYDHSLNQNDIREFKKTNNLYYLYGKYYYNDKSNKETIERFEDCINIKFCDNKYEKDSRNMISMCYYY